MLPSDLDWIAHTINTSGEVFLSLWVTPGKPHTHIKDVRSENIDGTMTRIIRMDVAAAPERGNANAAICRFFERALDFPVRCTIIAGQIAKHKILKIARL